MSDAFLFIIQKFINKTNNNYSFSNIHDQFETWKHIRENEYDDVHDHLKMIFYQFISSVNMKQSVSKFTFFYKNLSSIFLKGNDLTKFIDTFCNIQKTYRGMCKLAFLYKWKRAKIQINTDLFLNELTQDQSNVITVCDNGSKYLFVISDLVKIFRSSLSNSPYFFSSPLPCKNPYNNIPFTKANLYNIYFYIRFRNSIVPDLVQYYFLCDFSLKLFKKKYAHCIRKYAIQSYLDNTPKNILYSNVLDMIYEHDYKKCLRINPTFPVQKLIDIMKPYMLLYYKSKYSITRSENRRYYDILHKKMKEFIIFNPSFGKVMKPAFSFSEAVILYNDKHIVFSLKEPPSQVTFQNSHLTMDADESEDEMEIEDQGYDSF